MRDAYLCPPILTSAHRAPAFNVIFA